MPTGLHTGTTVLGTCMRSLYKHFKPSYEHDHLWQPTITFWKYCYEVEMINELNCERGQ